MTQPQPDTIGTQPAYWTHKVGQFPAPVAVTRMAQLIDFDDRLYEAARVVYRFLISWYHDEHGDALMSMRHVSLVMRQRAPDGATVPSRSAVQRAIIALMETGWVVRTFKGRGKGKGASRYVPVLNVLDLAAEGKFPQPSHPGGTVEPTHANGTLLSHANGTVGAEPSRAGGTKTHTPDSAPEPRTGMGDIDCAPPASGLSADAVAQGGFEELYKCYGVRAEFAAAKVAYEKLAPTPAMHAEMIASAKAWRATAGDIERMYLARWIREERFREDPKGERRGREAKPKSAMPKATPADGPDKILPVPIWERGKVEDWPEGSFPVKIIGSQVERQEHSTDTALLLSFRLLAPEFGGEEHEHLIWTCAAYNPAKQSEGVKHLQDIMRSVNLESVEDSDALHDRLLRVTVAGGAITYTALTDQEFDEAADIDSAIDDIDGNRLIARAA